MSILLWVLLAIVLFAALLLLLIFLFAYALTKSMAPTSIEDSVRDVKKFLEYDFGEDYTVLSDLSQNNHPDRPLSIQLQLSETAMKEVREQVSLPEITSTSEEYNQDKTNKYVVLINIKPNGFSKQHTASYVYPDGGKYDFFRATLEVDYEQMTITYHESMM
jgi:hypothetical protein